MDWGMRHKDVGMEMVIMPAMQHWTAWDLVLVFPMWALMMVAMTVPAASPVILLFAEINRRRNEQQGTFVANIPVWLVADLQSDFWPRNGAWAHGVPLGWD
jgi:predicted metal-binding membrane protein